jgi:hypothetical protein
MWMRLLILINGVSIYLGMAQLNHLPDKWRNKAQNLEADHPEIYGLIIILSKPQNSQGKRSDDKTVRYLKRCQYTLGFQSAAQRTKETQFQNVNALHLKYGSDYDSNIMNMRLT